jgi:hypothetical protein
MSAEEIEVTPEMIEAGVNALLLRGIGGEPGDSMHLLRKAVADVFTAMAAAYSQKSPRPSSPKALPYG